jgi:hypothetical protein
MMNIMRFRVEIHLHIYSYMLCLDHACAAEFSMRRYRKDEYCLMPAAVHRALTLI